MAELPDTALPVYNMKAVVEATGISAETLRSWERRFGILLPARTSSGYRKYTPQDVQTIRWLQARLAEGFTIGRAVDLLRARGTLAEAASGSPPDAFGDELTVACRNFDERAAEHAIAGALAVYPVDVVCLRVLTPALVAIGDCAAHRPVELGAAYFAAELIRARLLALHSWAACPAAGPLVLLSGAPGEAHDLGLLMLAIFARRAGLRTLLLGAVPDAAVIAETARQRRPAAVCLSTSSPQTLAAALELVRALRDDARSQPPEIVVGGGAAAAAADRISAAGARFGGADAAAGAATLLSVLRAGFAARAS